MGSRLDFSRTKCNSGGIHSNSRWIKDGEMKLIGVILAAAITSINHNSSQFNIEDPNPNRCTNNLACSSSSNNSSNDTHSTTPHPNQPKEQDVNSTENPIPTPLLPKISILHNYNLNNDHDLQSAEQLIYNVNWLKLI